MTKIGVNEREEYPEKMDAITEDDLYLDVVVKPTGDILLLDEDELKEAFDKKEMTKDDNTLAALTLLIAESNPKEKGFSNEFFK